MISWTDLFRLFWRKVQGYIPLLFPKVNVDEQFDADAFKDHGVNPPAGVVTANGDLVAGPHFDPELTVSKIFHHVPVTVWATVVTHQPDGFSMWGVIQLTGSPGGTTTSTPAHTYPTVFTGAGVTGISSNDARMLFSNHVATSWNFPQNVERNNAWSRPQAHQPFVREASKGFALRIEELVDDDAKYWVELLIPGYRELRFRATDINGVLFSPLDPVQAVIASGQQSEDRMVVLVSLRAARGQFQRR